MCLLYTQLDTELQHYYEVLAEKLSADIAHTVVWEGAAKNQDVKNDLYFLDAHGYSYHRVCMNTCPLRYLLLAPVIIQGKG